MDSIVASRHWIWPRGKHQLPLIFGDGKLPSNTRPTTAIRQTTCSFEFEGWSHLSTSIYLRQESIITSFLQMDCEVFCCWCITWQYINSLRIKHWESLELPRHRKELHELIISSAKDQRQSSKLTISSVISRGVLILNLSLLFVLFVLFVIFILFILIPTLFQRPQ
jgi:hypothetical protein